MKDSWYLMRQHFDDNPRQNPFEFLLFHFFLPFPLCFLFIFAFLVLDFVQQLLHIRFLSLRSLLWHCWVLKLFFLAGEQFARLISLLSKIKPKHLIIQIKLFFFLLLLFQFLFHIPIPLRLNLSHPGNPLLKSFPFHLLFLFPLHDRQLLLLLLHKVASLVHNIRDIAVGQFAIYFEVSDSAEVLGEFGQVFPTGVIEFYVELILRVLLVDVLEVFWLAWVL